MVGETVITIGNAFGYENTVSVGIISALHRDVTLSDDQVYRNLIQTDACINPGNSGGPLINIDGELIGINVAVRAGAQGIGFALPIDEVKRVAAEMLSTRRLASTWHGLVADDQRARLAAAAVVVRGPAGKPGAKRPGSSRATSWSGWATWRSPARSMSSADCSTPARPADERCRSAGASGEQSLALDVRPAAPGMTRASGQRPTRRAGLAALGPEERCRSRPTGMSRRLPKLRGGLYVQAVPPGSPAAQAAIQKGDILVGMNVGTRHWETIRPDNILYVLRQPEAARPRAPCSTSSAATAFSRARISLAETRVRKTASQ